jgi:hypothetical protein
MSDDQKPVGELTDDGIATELAKPQRKRRLTELLFERDHRRNVDTT